MFSREEAVALLLSLTLFRSLHSQPCMVDLQSAEKKLLAAMPETLRAILAEAEKVISFEGIPHDTFHPERVTSAQTMTFSSRESEQSAESETTTLFL
jgi:predicted DNA-binding transcriptional regulator YafY